MLDLNDLANGYSGITPAYGGCIAEAAGVCLESQNHARGVLLRTNSGNEYDLDWPEISEQAVSTWAEEEKATELGAEAVSALLAKRETDHAGIRRSRRGSGFDYWLGDDSSGFAFQERARLEISGIRSGDDHQVRRRVQQKLRQTMNSESTTSLPAIAIVVEFGRPLAEIGKRCNQ